MKSYQSLASVKVFPTPVVGIRMLALFGLVSRPHSVNWRIFHLFKSLHCIFQADFKIRRIFDETKLKVAADFLFVTLKTTDGCHWRAPRRKFFSTKKKAINERMKMGCNLKIVSLIFSSCEVLFVVEKSPTTDYGLVLYLKELLDIFLLFSVFGVLWFIVEDT